MKITITELRRVIREELQKIEEEPEPGSIQKTGIVKDDELASAFGVEKSEFKKATSHLKSANDGIEKIGTGSKEIFANAFANFYQGGHDKLGRIAGIVSRAKSAK